MVRSLLAYDANGEVVGVLDSMVARDGEGKVVGLIDFGAHEDAGGRLRDVWEHSEAVGSATWPEWLGRAAFDFKVELDPSPGLARAKIARLVHKQSGHKRERAAIEAAIEDRVAARRAEAHEIGEQKRALLRQKRLPEVLVERLADPAPRPADVRDIVGGPGKPLLIDAKGRTKKRRRVERPVLPIVRRGVGRV